MKTGRIVGAVSALVLAGLLMGPQTTAQATTVSTHAVGAAAQAGSLSVAAPVTDTRPLAAANAVSDSKKKGEKKKKKGGFFKKFGFAAVIVFLLIVLLVVVAITFAIRRSSRRGEQA
ncbi:MULTISPECIES: hypothetical protein [unclassified Streptomyces]|uniref:hypothetical protein n=1 Tax=unclassified Streptomyces TaxID=2593676 RepID=UPI001BEB7340|nr:MULTISPECIES: hypothetical protein [unclassified Streptomyces]MBT2408623.1 hypothetical protein [Streptomyces sp. ISL-21]MBT2455501.1 hypothetical protein [Streptomyces sp. ISL-86]MBT2608693.1 hypothetical protein [Streptomyces sp. ISL-87]